MRLIDRLASRAVKGSTPAPEPAIRSMVEDTRTTLRPGFARQVVEMRDNLPEFSREASDPDFVHLSELVTLCARRQALLLDTGSSTQLKITGAHRVMWKIGRAVENHVRDQLIDGAPNLILGRWRCRCHATLVVGHKRHDTVCPQCQARPDHYQEYPLYDRENGVVGNPDIIMREPGQAYVPVEIKSMVKTQWDELRAPLGNHIMQAAGYRRLLQVNQFRVHPDVSILYVAKDFAWGSPYKEFHVKVTPTIERQLDDLFAEARRVKEWRTTGRLPSRVCDRQDCSRAAKCSVAESCFGRSNT